MQTRGFTLIELLVVVLIIAMLAALAVPQYFKVVEKGRVAEVTAYIGVLRGAQDRYAVKADGAYASSVNLLDVDIPAFKYFSNAPITAGGTVTTGWQATFTRNSAGSSASYGAYTVIFNSVTGDFTSDNINAARDLLPQ